MCVNVRKREERKGERREKEREREGSKWNERKQGKEGRVGKR